MSAAESVQSTVESNDVAAAVAAVRRFTRVPSGPVAQWGLVLGSGLGHVGDRLLEDGGRSLGYDEVPGFPVSAVAGHAGRIVLGSYAGTSVLVLQGRVHHYEGHDVATLTRPVRTLLELGVENLVLTNAAGGVNPAYRAGDLMLIEDHICWLPTRVQGLRTPDVWNRGLHSRAVELSRELEITVHSGVYASMPGPTYETHAEVRMMGILGADAVGMSTVPEAVAAAGRARVVGISCITNVAAGLDDNPISHEHVAEVGRAAGPEFGRLVLGLISSDDRS